jgi:hypothetical protein
MGQDYENPLLIKVLIVEIEASRSCVEKSWFKVFSG